MATDATNSLSQKRVSALAIDPVGKRRTANHLARLKTITTNIQVISRLCRAGVHNPTTRVTLPAILPKNTKIEWRNVTLRCSVRACSTLCDCDRILQRESRPLVSLSFKDVRLSYIWCHVPGIELLFFGSLSFVCTEYPNTRVVPVRLTVDCKLKQSNSLSSYIAFYV